MDSPPPPVALGATGFAGCWSAMRLPGPPDGIGGGGGPGPRLDAEVAAGAAAGLALAPASGDLQPI